MGGIFFFLFFLKCTESGFGSSNDTEPRGLGDTHLHQHQQISSDYKQTSISASEHREKYYATTQKPVSEQQSPTGNTLERIPEYSEDIYPYATFHLPDEENLAGNPMMMSRYGASNNAGTIPISANLYNSRNSMPSVKKV